MALSQSTLKAKLLDMGLFSTEPAACAAWAHAYRLYFASAAAGAVPVVPSALDAPENAMKGGMTGLSVTGPAAIQAGVLAFWTSLAGVAASAFPASTTVTPPAGVSALSGTLTAVFAANMAGSKSAADSYDAIATAIHAASAGGQAVFPPPPGGIGPQPIT
jgi:hypothetical protein